MARISGGSRPDPGGKGGTNGVKTSPGLENLRLGLCMCVCTCVCTHARVLWRGGFLSMVKIKNKAKEIQDV